MTTRVTFYDIGPEARFSLAVKLAQAAWEKDRRMLVRCRPDEAAALDQHLWVFREESFVPHEVCDDPARLLDPEAHVVIITRDHRTIPADILLQLGLTPERVMLLLDHGVRWALPNLVLGMMVIVPVWLVVYLFRPPRG